MRAKKAKTFRKIAKTQLREKQSQIKRDLLVTSYLPASRGTPVKMNFCLKKLTKSLKNTYNGLKKKGMHTTHNRIGNRKKK